MKKNKLHYPENAYRDLLGEAVLPNMPPDAEETLEYLIGTLLQQEADFFMLRYKDRMTYSKIGKSYGGLSVERTRQIIAKASRKLRHPSRNKILLMGREAYLQSVAAENEEKKRQYNERIAQLEELTQRQDTEIAELQEKLLSLNNRAQPTNDVLGACIAYLDLSARSWNALTRAGIKTVKDILVFDDLLNLPNLGQVSVQEIQDKLRAFINAAEQG